MSRIAKEQGTVVSSEKKQTRGIASARGTTRLKFSHEMSKQNGLFLAHLESVTVTESKLNEETGLPSFNGLSLPRLTLVFASNETEAEKKHYVTLSFTPAESNATTIPGGKDEWKVNSVFDWLKHILNVFYLKGREFTDEEAEDLSLDYTDFDENGDYISVEPDVVLESWKTLFENFETIMNHGGKDDSPIYVDKDGKPITVWIKLLRYYRTNKGGWTPVNNGDLAFPVFVGEGCIEVYHQNTPSSIRLNTVREAIIPMNIEKPKAPNMPAITNMVAGINVAPTMMSNTFTPSAAIEQVEEDLPF